jgi:hypothetical protein
MGIPGYRKTCAIDSFKEISPKATGTGCKKIDTHLFQTEPILTIVPDFNRNSGLGKRNLI